MRNPAFNKEQREGLARVSDNIATASVIAALLGGFVDQKVTIIGVLILIVSYILRKGADNGG